MPGRAYKRETERRDRRPDGQRQPAADARDQAARPSRQREHDQRERQQRRARLPSPCSAAPGSDSAARGTRRRSSAAYSSSVSRLASVNGARSEQRQRQHRIRARGARRRRAARATSAPIAERTDARADGAAPSGGHSSRPKTTPPRPRTASAAPVQSMRAVRDGSRLSSMNRSDSSDDHDGERHVQEEHRAPADVLDQPAAADRADRRRDRAESRPRADRPAAFGLVERRADDREAARARGTPRRCPAARGRR